MSLHLQKLVHTVLQSALIIVFASLPVAGQTPCPRFPAGSVIHQPFNLVSKDGLLQTAFTYQTRTDQNGHVLYCFSTASGLQSPTLRVRPGDLIKITLQNLLPDAGSPMHHMPEMSMSSMTGSACAAAMMTATSTNLHYHGTNTPPTCHQDEVIHTAINAGQSFQYELKIPSDEPPGMYWYHPHVHGMSEPAVQGGASGAIIVEGIENVNPVVAGLPQQVLIIRDNPVVNHGQGNSPQPTWDVSLNYAPIAWPDYQTPIITMKPGEKQFWRVLNASADSIMDLQLQYDGKVQPLEVVALDGVPTGSQDGTARGKSIFLKHILMAPAARAEFILAGPSATVQDAQLLTLNVNSGSWGPVNPQRPLGRIQVNTNAAEPSVITPAVSAPPPAERFAGLATAAPTAERKLFFSEDSGGFYITVDGQTPVIYSSDNPPAIVTTQGSVEDWTIENRSLENHEFHIHQIHFLFLEQNGKPVLPAAQQYLDTIQIPYWSGTGPYPSVKVRMDFRGQITGDFVYHCHILVHEDYGMMAIIRVKPAP